MSLFILSFGALLSVINPLGTLPMFIGLTSGKPNSEIVSIAIRASINTFVILLVAFFLGSYILQFFGISLYSLRIAGGIIIASSGFALLTGNFNRHKGMKRKEKDDASTRSEISLTPIAIPMLAGPGSISLLITYYQEHQTGLEILILLLAILLVCVITLVLLLSSNFIVKKLGASGINALSRIIGFIVISIGVEFILGTILEIVHSFNS